MTVLTHPWRTGPQADLSALPVSLDLRAISMEEGLRAALAVAATMLLSQLVHLPALASAAVGALLTCLCDAGGPVRRRVPALLAFAAIGAALTVGFGLLRPLGLLLTVPLAAATIFVLSFARVWSPAAMQVGNLLVVVTILSLDRIEPPRAALEAGVLFGAGSIWALILTMAVWRLHPYRPVRQVTANIFRRLGLMVAEFVPMLDGTLDGNGNDGAVLERWTDHARAHRRHVRDGIEAARTLVVDTVRIRGGGSVRASQSLIQVEAADQLFGTLIALSDVLEQADAPTRAAAARALPALRLLLAALADATAHDHATDDPAVRNLTGRMLAAFSRLDAVPALAGLSQAIVARLRIALLLTTPEGLVPGKDGTTGRQRWQERILGPVRANLGWDSAILRHATRCGVVAGPALAFTLWTGHAYAHWLTITLVLTLQPFFALTWQKALERSAGTVLGGIGAAAIALAVHGPLAIAAVIVPLAIAAFACRAVSFALFMVFLTPMVVLLSELGSPGTSEFAIAAYRALFTIAGGLLAVGSALVLWPSWEPARIRECLASAIGAHAAYADLELAALLAPGTIPSGSLETVRRRAGLASNNLETALNRALQEPRQAARREAQSALVVDAALRRLAGRLLALQHDPAQAGCNPRTLIAWRDWFAQSFTALAANRPLPCSPPEQDHPAMSRMARQLSLIAGAMRPRQVRAPGESVG